MYKKGKLKKPIQYSFTVLLIVLFNHIYTVSKESKQARRKESREQTSVEQINSQTTGIHPERIKNKTKQKQNKRVTAFLRHHGTKKDNPRYREST